MTGHGRNGAHPTRPLRFDVKDKTKFTHLGRPKPSISTPVNPAITKASTLLFEKAEDLYNPEHLGYGRHGSPLHDAVELAFNELESGAGTSLTPSGFAACTLAVLAVVKSGDHILVTDSIYGPTRDFCENFLKGLGIEAERYAPRIGAGIESLIRPNTSAIISESPGSLTFEIQDLPALVAAAKGKDIAVIVDNTWSGGITYNPLTLGADLSIHAATKYMGGHSDVLFGAVVSRTKDMAKKVAKTRKYLGLHCAPDDTYQILRGFRTLHTRFKTQEQAAEDLARWMEQQDFVQEVLHPALESHLDHAIWKRDFTGGGALFSVVLKPASTAEVNGFINALKYFGIGFSYGGYESVVIHCDPQLNRKFSHDFGGPLVRFGCGLEDLDDLKADITQAAQSHLISA